MIFLSDKMEHYGIQGVTLDLFKSYLQNQPQIVKFGGMTSNPLTVKCRAPQGIVVGSLLFLICIK